MQSNVDEYEYEEDLLLNFARRDKLFDVGSQTISTYAAVNKNVTLVVQYLNSDYKKVLPKFYDILDVPFISVAEVAR